MALIRTLVWHASDVFPLTPGPATNLRARVRIFDASDASPTVSGIQEFREVDLAFAAGTAVETALLDIQSKIIARLNVLYPANTITRPVSPAVLSRTLVWHAHDVFPLVPGPATNCKVRVRLFDPGAATDAVEGINEFRELELAGVPGTAIETALLDVQTKVLARLNVLYPNKNIIRPT